MVAIPAIAATEPAPMKEAPPLDFLSFLANLRFLALLFPEAVWTAALMLAAAFLATDGSLAAFYLFALIEASIYLALLAS